MKTVWVLYERSDLDQNSEYDHENYSTSCRVFENFETARTAMQKLLKEYATDDNSLFDGQGNIKNLAGQCEKYYSEEDDDEEMLEDRKKFEFVDYLLNKLCLAEITQDDIDSIEEIYVTNYMYDAEITTDNGITLLIKPDDDGPFNGVYPYIHTNMFIMDDENKDYFFYVEDSFEMPCNYVSNLYINLKKVEIE